MKQIFLFIILSFLISCSESFKNINPGKFNGEIAGRTDLKTPEDLIKAYYGSYEGEGSKKTIDVENLPDNAYEITFIHEGIGDDSQFAEKIIMTAKLKGQTWTVVEIKENWKCHNGRGHTGWGTGVCN